MVWTGIFQGNINISSTIKDLGWLTVLNKLLYRNAQMAFKIMNGGVPFYLTDMLTKRFNIPNCNTHNRLDPNAIKCRTRLAQRSFNVVSN